jgi:hypothetical protein
VAVIFELVVNFGDNEEALSRAELLCDAVAPLHLGDIDIPLGGPYVTRFAPGSGYSERGRRPGYIEFSVTARGIQYGGYTHPQISPSQLAGEEFGELARQLYNLLKRFEGYEVANVGMDPEETVDLDALAERLAESGLERLEGLVLRDSLVERFGLTRQLQPFSVGYQWLPFDSSV